MIVSDIFTLLDLVVIQRLNSEGSVFLSFFEIAFVGNFFWGSFLVSHFKTPISVVFQILNSASVFNMNVLFRNYCHVTIEHIGKFALYQSISAMQPKVALKVKLLHFSFEGVIA